MNLLNQISVLGVLGILLTTGCSKVSSDDVNNDALYGQYSVTYDQSAGDLNYFVQYTVGSGPLGTTVELSSLSKIETAGKLLHKADLLGGVYYALEESASPLQGTYDFLWTRSDGTTYLNTIPMASSLSISSPGNNSTQSKSVPLVVTVAGAALASNETFYATLEASSSSSGNQITRLTKTANAGFQITFSAQDLSTFVTGPAKLTVKREKRGFPQNGHPKYGGSMISSYVGPYFSIVISN